MRQLDRELLGCDNGATVYLLNVAHRTILGMEVGGFVIVRYVYNEVNSERLLLEKPLLFYTRGLVR